MTTTAAQAIMDALLSQTGASRTTLRVATADGQFPVIAETLTPGMRSLREASVRQLDPRATAGLQWLERERRVLIQQDCTRDDPIASPQLVDFYGVGAQMLAPLLDEGGQLIGVISVHQRDRPHDWTADDRQALEDAVAASLREIATPDLDS